MAGLLGKLLRTDVDVRAAQAEAARIPSTVGQRLERGRAEMKRGAPMRRLCVRFERGDTYWQLNGRGDLSQQSTVTDLRDPTSKPPHRVRKKNNFIRPIITSKVSAATQRTPQPRSSRPAKTRNAGAPPSSGSASRSPASTSGGCTTSTCAAPTTRSAAAAKGSPSRTSTRTSAPTGRSSRPTRDRRPVIDETTGQPSPRRSGRARSRWSCSAATSATGSPAATSWSRRWHAIERARPIEDIEEMPGFFGDKLVADAATSGHPDRPPPGEHGRWSPSTSSGPARSIRTAGTW
jgi:hypothetical protein